MLFHVVEAFAKRGCIALSSDYLGENLQAFLFCLFCEPAIKAMCIASPHASVAVILGQESSAPCGLGFPAE